MIQPPRTLFVGTLATLSVVVIAATGWLVGWPIWQEHRTVQELIKRLESRDEDERKAAGDALLAFGPRVVPPLIRVLHNPKADWIARLESADILAKAAPQDPRVLTALISALDDKSENLRQDVLQDLGSMGSNAKAAVPAIAERLQDPVKDVRTMAAVALGQIGPDATAAVPSLIEAMHEEHLRRTVIRTLGSIGPGAEQTVPALIEALGDDDPATRGIAADALGQMGSAARAAVPSLMDAVGDKDRYVSGRTRSALRQIDPAAAIRVLFRGRPSQ